MGHVALQRVIVRMLYDPAFASGVYDDAAAALRDCDVDVSERQWLVASDARAWRVDPYRRSRSLTGLVEEFPVASALVVRRAGGAAALDAFFSGEVFHAGMQAGHYLALDFADYLYGIDEPWVAAVAGLERALAAARRRVARGGEGWRLAAHVRLATLPLGGLSFYQEALARLRGTDLVAAVIDPEFELAVPAGEPSRHEHVMAVASGGDAHLERLTPELFAILDTARGGAPDEEMLATFRRLGATEAEAREVLAGFVETGELLAP